MPENIGNDLTSNAAVVKTERQSWKDTSFFIILRQFMKNKLTVVGALILLVLILMAIFAPHLSRYAYTDVDIFNMHAVPSSEHVLGTDILGRDIWERICYGARYSLSLGVVAEIVGMLIGIVFGCIAGYFGGVLDNIILRICDIMQAIPSVLLAICISQVLGSGYVPTVIALAITGIPQVIRILRAQLLSLRTEEYIEAAQAINCSTPRIMFKHMLPNALAPVIINSSMGIGAKIMTSASLSFLGLGIQEPLPEWGAMLSAGKQYFRYYPHLVLIPGIFIAITVLAFNLVGDGLRDALDPKLRR